MTDPIATPDAGAAHAPAFSIQAVPHHPLDARWIEAQLSRLPFRGRAARRQRYGPVYKAAFDAEPDSIRREG